MNCDCNLQTAEAKPAAVTVIDVDGGAKQSNSK